VSDTTIKTIHAHEYGAPEVLVLERVPRPEPNADQVLIQLKAAGVNPADWKYLGGVFKQFMPLQFPWTPGMEGSGVVESVGTDVTEVQLGDRVAYAMTVGAYAELAVVPSRQLVKIPATMDFSSAAAVMLQGMTAHYLTHSTYAIQPGDTILVHAAAGGVGLLLCQIAKIRGARVIGTVSTEAKAELAREAGADDVILYTESDFETETKRITGGSGVQVVYDSVGRDTFLKGLNVLAPRGMMALFGQSSGTVAPLDPSVLAQKGSLFLTRPSLAQYSLTREELLWRAGDVLDWVGSGKLRLRIERTFPLAEASEAHRELEGRRTTGKVLLIP